MNRSLLAALLCLALAVPALAQDDRLDELSFDEGVSLKDEALPYFAIGVGPVVSFSFPNLDALNVRATELGLAELKTPFIQAGVELFTAVGIVPNVRIGFSWITGSRSSEASIAVGTDTVNRTMEYSLGSRTVHIDYAWVPFRGFSVIPGAGFGWATQTISTYQAPSGIAWDALKDPATPAPSTVFTEMRRSALSVVPRLNIEYAVAPWVALRAQAAYTLQVSDSDWEMNRTAVVTGVPENIKATAFSAQLGLFIGLFN
ncbi:MAG: hypothetical protein SGJ05_07575 [bacterium]|nr:hypothetical protein [bacterium]